jgi:DNA segregation ATPase FtsK/SpoIIIE-like protein
VSEGRAPFGEPGTTLVTKKHPARLLDIYEFIVLMSLIGEMSLNYPYNLSMTDISALEDRLSQLEGRVEELETLLTSKASDRKLMDSLYQQAKRLVIKHQRASVIFLQKKMLIDYPRAAQLVDRLEKEGIVGPACGASPRKVISKINP